MASDPSCADGLDRFLVAQRNSYGRALAELRAGRKRTHWMWFIFPQIDGLGRSSTAQHYAIKSREEAKAFLAHPVLGERLRECCCILQGAEASASQIFGFPDNLKFRSSLTLFEEVADDDSLFVRLLEKFYGGQRDQTTLQLLKQTEQS